MSTAPTSIPRRYAISVDEYARMLTAGALDNRRVELIDGEIIEMPSQGEPHFFVLWKTARLLERIFPEDRFWVRPQASLRVGGHVPDPDIAILPGIAAVGGSVFNQTTPLLIVEVSDSTLRYDLTDKASLYASADVEDYWVMDVRAKQIVVHRNPVLDPAGRFGSSFSVVNRFSGNDLVAPLAMPTAAISVKACFD